MAEPGALRGIRSVVDGRRDEAPGNQLPVLLDSGGLVWRGADVAITATAFLVYTTGIDFQIIGCSSRIQFHDREMVAEVRTGLEKGAVASIGSLSFDAIGTSPVISAISYTAHRFQASGWLPFLSDDDIELFLEWPSQGIAYKAFQLPRRRINTAAGQIISLW